MPAYMDFVSQYSAYLQSLGQYKCHTVERFNCPLANNQGGNYGKLKTARTSAVFSYGLQNTEECVLDIVYDFLKKPSPPSGKCAVYTCPKKLNAPDHCIELTVNSTAQNPWNAQCKICNSTYICDKSNWDPTSSQTGFNRSCTLRDAPQQTRLPGEKCSNGTDCDPLYGKCNKGVCNATMVGCYSDKNCLVGSFCQGGNDKVEPKINGTCTPQLAKGAKNCTRDFECQNGQGCVNSNCTDYFSINAGTPISSNETPTWWGVYCKSQMYDPVTKKCDGLSYSGMQAPDKTGFVNCTLGNQCTYVTIASGAPVSKTCECPFSPTGQPYCPKAYNDTDKVWTNYAKAKQAVWANKECHTTNRQFCYAVTSAYTADVWEAKVSSETAHQFVGADWCVKEIFGSSSIFKVSLLAIGFIIFHLL